MIDETDQVLLRACRRGDDAAARALFLHLGPVLKAVAQAIVRDESLSDDAVQNAMCRIFGVSTREVDRVENAKAWLIKIVRREAMSILRTDGRALRRNREYESMRAAARESRPPLQSDLQEIRRYVEQLPRRLAEIIILKHIAAMTFEQIALALSLNRNTAASRYRDAMEALRQLANGAASIRPVPQQEKTHAR